MGRLTECIDSHLLDNGKLDKEYSLSSKIELNDYSCMDIPNAVYNKLGELEDVLEKYGIESAEELETRITVNEKFIKQVHKEVMREQVDEIVSIYAGDYIEQVKQLKHQLAVKDRALDIACHSNISNCMSEEISGMKDYFIKQAEDEIFDSIHKVEKEILELRGEENE